MSGEELSHLTHDQLIERAKAWGITSPASMTREALIAKLEQHAPTEKPPVSSRRTGWLGRARDLVARVVEQGLHLPDAASLLRGVTTPPPQAPPPLPTVTLAEIYAAQGHLDKAIAVLDEVLESSPHHEEARKLRARFVLEGGGPEEPNIGDAETPPAVGSVVVTNTDDVDTIMPPETLRTRGADSSEQADPATASATPDSSDAAPLPSTDVVASGSSDSSDAPPRVSASASSEEAPPPTTSFDHEVVCLATDPTSLFVYWEIRPIVFARARWRDPRGKLVLRIVVVKANLGAESASVLDDERDLEIDGLSGERFVRGLTPDSNVRLCVAWLGPRGFVPLAIASEVAMPRDYVSKTVAVTTATPATAARWRKTGWFDDTGTPLPGSPAHQARSLDFSEAVRHAKRAHELFRRGNTPRGGASDLIGWGGASDLHGGASDLSRRAVDRG